MINCLQVPACLEILYDQITRESTIIIVHCQSNKDRQVNTINAFFPQLAYVRKCCSHNTIYDSRTKVCVPWLNKSESLVTFLSNRSTDVDFVIANESSPTCKGPIVDYEIDEDDVFLRNGTYSVSETFKIVSKFSTIVCFFIRKRLSQLHYYRDLIFSGKQIMCSN